MSRRSILAWVFSLLFLLFGLALLVVAFLPVGTMQDLADTLAGDGDFGSLTPANATVFRFLLATIAGFLMGCAALSYFHLWAKIRFFLVDLWGDFGSFFATLVPQKRELPWWVVILFLIALGVILRLEYVNSSLHHDEAYTYMAFAHTLRAAITDYHLPNNHVFHSIMVFISTQLLGDAPWAVRFPAFTAGVLIIPATYALGKRLYNRVVGLSAGLLVAISPAMIAYSDNARGYTLVALFGLLLLVLGHRVYQSKDRFAWLLIILVSSLGMYTVPSFLFSFGILYLWLLLESLRKVSAGYSSLIDFLKYWLVSGIFSALLTLLLYLPILIYSGTDSLLSNPFVSPVPWNDFPETLVQRLRETWLEWTFRVPVWLVILLVSGWVLALFLHKRISSIRVPMQLSSLLWISLLLVIQRPNAWSKVWFFLLPLILLWAAAGIFGLLGLMHLKSIPISAILLILVGAFIIYKSFALIPQLPELWRINGDEESAVIYIQDMMKPADGLVVAPPDDAPVWYYAQRHGISEALSQADTATQWYVLVNDNEGQTPASVMAERGPGLLKPPACSPLDEFGKITVYLCREAR